jgi:hypothetical protein
MSGAITVEVMPSCEVASGPDRYDYTRLPEELRDQAMLAQGTVLTKLRGATERVIDAGNTLRWAKATLPHGEYLPWVEQACGLKERYARQLVQAAEWVNRQHAAGLESITDATTLFLLSADATPDDVREWVMERCAAGSPPTRKEVQERKRQAQGQSVCSIVHEAMSALKLSPEARALAASAQHISTRQLMDDLGIEELPRGRLHETETATYCRNGTGWWKFPIVTAPSSSPFEVMKVAPLGAQVVRIAIAAEHLGKTTETLRVGLSPARIRQRGYIKGNGWEARPHPERGFCELHCAGA